MNRRWHRNSSKCFQQRPGLFFCSMLLLSIFLLNAPIAAGEEPSQQFLPPFLATVLDGDPSGAAAAPDLGPCGPVDGRCSGFDYSGQCATSVDPGCAATDIGVDQNCDGRFEDCRSCPAGTAPADLNGDGCPDACGCSPESSTGRPIGGELEIVDVDEEGVPIWVNGDRLGVLPGSDPLARAGGNGVVRAALTRVAALMRLDPDNLSFKSMSTDASGDSHARLQQVIEGRNVINGELLVHARGSSVYSVQGSARADLPRNSRPGLDAETALRIAREILAGERIDLGDGAGIRRRVEAPYLAYFRRLNAEEMPELALVWVVRLTGRQRDQTPVDEILFLSALDGELLGRDSKIQTTRIRNIFTANLSYSLPGTLVRGEAGPAVADGLVNTNHSYLGATYDCYQSLFGRDSYNGAGAPLVSTVHYGNQYNNAYWTAGGMQMVFGDGDGSLFSSFPSSMDVTAHELTHAVTGASSGLIYSGESGGLNEAMSDIFGAVCEWNLDSQVISADTWRVGENIYTPGIGGDALRFMNDPANDGSSLDYYPDYHAGVDVHYSSGIANLAFYLLASGGSHPRGKTSNVVPAIGMTKAAQIFYRANAFLLTPGSTFKQALVATTQAAYQLGYSKTEIGAVKEAWKAVGVAFKEECETCFKHSQCAPGALCRLGKCATGKSVKRDGACCRDYQCATGSCNSNGRCQCTQDAHCGAGQYCALGFLGVGHNQCLAFKAECEDCTLSKQCAAGALCRLGKCASGDSVGLGGSCCRDYQCTTGSCNVNRICQCTNDSQCPAGQRCALGVLGVGRNRCEPFIGECQACFLSSQCGPGALCRLGRCATGKSLNSGQSCCRDYQCKSGNCKLNGKCK